MNTEDQLADTQVDTAKQDYQAPTLTEHGTVKQLTQGGAPGAPEPLGGSV